MNKTREEDPLKKESLHAQKEAVLAHPNNGPEAPVTANPPFSIFTKGEKWIIVTLASFAGLFSPLSSSIYLPAIPRLVNVFHKSTELINLTVTIYVIMQGIAPMVWGPASDHIGRRLSLCSCLIILSLTCVGLALVPVHDYWLLLLLRCLQAAGSASTIAIGAGVIGDISTREERGGFYGIFTLGPMIGPSIGPVIGGALSDGLGWRSIFWFLCIASSVCLVTMILFFPETLRAMVGDGSIKPPTIFQPLLPVIGRRKMTSAERPPPKRWQNPLHLLTYKDILILLGMNAIICAIYYGFIATMPTLFTEAYPFLEETKIGLCFLGVGGGMAIGSTANGKFLDWEYRKFKSKTVQSHNTSEALPNDSSQEDGVPVEKARLRALPFLIVVLIVCCVGYGWCIEKRVHLAVPLIIQIIVGYISIAVMNSSQTLMIDLFPAQGSSVTGCNNLIRCLLSAALVAVIDPIINGLGVGWTYVLLGGLSFLSIPMVFWSIKVGPECRKKRRDARNH